MMLMLPRFSFGVGDRFARQMKAQLDAFIKAKAAGVEIAPVWNKSFREHSLIGTKPLAVRKGAEEAVAARQWKGPWFVDADHISLKNVDHFTDACNFYTIDVADAIGQPPAEADLQAFVAANRRFVGTLTIPGIAQPFTVTEDSIRDLGRRYLKAVKEAGEIYRHIEKKLGKGAFVAEVSMDECEKPQTPLDLFFILAGLAAEKVPAQTVAPKFSGRFNKGVDYVGDPQAFAREFEDDVAVLAFARKSFDLPASLKLSVHSGSDKFAIYPHINRTLKKTGAGLHLKTAGTTWLEELTGLAASSDEGLAIAREIYAQAYGRFAELSAPYATVIDIDNRRLPKPEEVNSWNGTKFASALRHNQKDPGYNLHFRQMIHVSFKVAAEMGERYVSALERNAASVGPQVTENIFERHMRPLFL